MKKLVKEIAQGAKGLSPCFAFFALPLNWTNQSAIRPGSISRTIKPTGTGSLPLGMGTGGFQGCGGMTRIVRLRPAAISVSGQPRLSLTKRVVLPLYQRGWENSEARRERRAPPFVSVTAFFRGFYFRACSCTRSKARSGMPRGQTVGPDTN
jgi:hypothetical protein